MKPTTDEFLVYYSTTDHVWLAHSFRTDQIGSGDCMLEAIESLLRGIKTIMSLAEKDPDIEVYHEAPADIQAKAKNAKNLPFEFIEIAYKRVHGNWPKGVPVHSTPSERVRFTASVTRKFLVGSK